MAAFASEAQAEVTQIEAAHTKVPCEVICSRRLATETATLW